MELRPTTSTSVLTAIEDAFGDVRFRDEMTRSLYQAEAWDSYETCDRSRDHQGAWQQLPERHLSDCQWALSHLDALGLHYYLPAVMSHYTRTPEEERLHIHDSLEFTLLPSLGNLRSYQQERFGPLTLAQRRAIYAFVQHFELEAEENWQRAAETEVDWFDAFNPK